MTTTKDELIESQKRTINALQNENHWLQDVIFNPSLNEIDMRLLVKNTPREIRMGLTSAEALPEKKIYFPDQAEKAHCSPKIASQHLRILAQKTGAFAYRIERDETTGNTVSYLQPLPPAETPAQLLIDRKARGGSTWEDGKRLKRCKDCGSANLVKVSQIICSNCGAEQTEKTYTAVNSTPDYHIDTESESTLQADNDSVGETDSQYDTRPPDEEISKLPSLRVYTQGVGEDPSPAPAPPTVSTNIAASDTDPGCQYDYRVPTALEELQALSQWVVWKYEQKPGKTKPDKVPYDVHRAGDNARADVSNPDTWSTYQEAQALYEKSRCWFTPYAGVGFVFNHNGIVGIDYDNSLDIRINSYSEISISGNGVHSYVRGSIPKGTRRNGIEMYDHGRFFTWTGNHLAGTPVSIEPGQAELDALFQELAPETIPIQPTPVQFPCSRSDEEILNKARNARNGAKFISLFGGDWSGYHSQSEADQALCKMLAYWCDNDVSAIDRLFRSSGLMREKWDRDDYRDRTITSALTLTGKTPVKTASSAEEQPGVFLLQATPEQSLKREELARREFAAMQAAKNAPKVPFKPQLEATKKREVAS